MAGKPWLSLSPRSALTSRPDQAQIHMLGERRQRVSTTFETQPSFGSQFCACFFLNESAYFDV
jgi:hypothetical protein